MSTVARIDVAVGSNISGFETGMRTVNDRLKSMQTSLNKFGSTMTRNFTLPIVAGLGMAVKGAAELEGAISKFDVVFAGMTDEMHAWVDTFRSEFPLARREIIKYAAGLQDLMVPMGINRELAADMVQEFMYVAGALAAFNDVPIGNVLEAISSGLAGMSRPLREYGADVTETSLKHHALAEGIWDGVAAWDAEIRAVALLSKLYEDSADAIDGLEEQKGSLLWMIEELKASFKDFGDEIGGVMLPAIKNVVDGILEWLGGLKDLNEEQLELIVKAALVVAAIGPGSNLAAAIAGLIALLNVPKGLVFAVGIAQYKMGEWISQTVEATGVSEEWHDAIMAIVRYAFPQLGTGMYTVIQNMIDAGAPIDYFIGKWHDLAGAVYSFVDAIIEAMNYVRRFFQMEELAKLGNYAIHPTPITGLVGDDYVDRMLQGKSPGGIGGWGDLFHTGGVFRAPRLGGEGYALLKDGETVTPAGVDAGQGGTSHITMNITQNITDQKTADYATNKLIEGLQKRGSNRGLF